MGTSADMDLTPFACAISQDRLWPWEEAYLLEGGRLRQVEQQAFFFAETTETEPKEYVWPPYFFKFEEWEERYEELFDHDDPPEPVTSRHGIVKCYFCSTDILLDEICARLAFGEIHVSQFMPSGKKTYEFDTTNEAHYFCASCTQHIGEQLDLWDMSFNNHGECWEGTQNLCWRGDCKCSQQSQSTLGGVSGSTSSSLLAGSLTLK